MPIRTTDDIRNEIAWLEDDILSCRNAMSRCTDTAERGEYRQRISANRRELVRLKTSLSLIEDDELF